MSSKALSAGDITEARCTKCRAVTNHTIVAMVEERIARVECNTCGGVHNYKEPKAAKEPKRKAPAAPRAPRKAPGAEDREEWESLAPAMDPAQALAYDINGAFKKNDLLNHPVFGLGIVKGVVGPRKMEVLFQEGKKLLRCQ